MAKVAIIGAGVVGAAIAYELSKVPGLEVILIDQNQPASGATGAALGVLMGVISHKTKGRAWKLRQTSMMLYEKLIPELESLTQETIPWNRQGLLMLLSPEDNLTRWEKLQKTRLDQGWELQIWNRAKLQKHCPQVNTEQVTAAIYSPQDRQVHPRLLTQALVKGARINGVSCHFGVRVENFLTHELPALNQRQCDRLQTNKGIFEVDWLVIAAGLGSTPLSTALQQTVDLRPVLGQALHLKLNTALGEPQFQPVITGNDVHIVPLGQGEYWVGATVEFSSMEAELTPHPELLEQVRQQAIAFCPALAEATILHTWWGKRPRPEGQPAPVIDYLAGYSNVLLATGHYRNGVLLAPATAAAIRDMITISSSKNCF